MARLIEADALRQAMWNWAEQIFADKPTNYEFNSMLTIIDAQPTVDAVPVVYGRWMLVGNDYEEWLECSLCGQYYGGDDTPNFCSNCGAINKEIEK